MSDKIPATDKWEGRSEGHKGNGPGLIDLGRGTMASPGAAEDILKKRSKDRATREHQKKHPEKLERSPIRAFVLGKNSGYKRTSEDTPKQKEEHIQDRMHDAKRSKRYENQK